MASQSFFVISLIFFCSFLLSIVQCKFYHNYPETYYVRENLNTDSTNYSRYILPVNLRPTKYNLTLIPNLTNRSFLGSVDITFNVESDTNVIILHANSDSIKIPDLPKLTSPTEGVINVTNSTFDPIHELVTFQLSNSIKAENDLKLYITYNGVLGYDMLGFYLSTYNTSSINHVMAITQFESTFARRAFPCFDEPQYRANFSINIVRTANQTSMSNMGLDESYSDPNFPGLTRDVYKTSPAMPTYLVAFGVSDLANITDGGKFRVFAREAAIQEGDYIKSVGQSILDSIGSFVGVTYPMEKMDVVAVPDFNAGAMENWGLTTYREKYVLFNQMKNTWLDKFKALSVVAHEFGHQWFGDLVTPQWWDCAWLNEAFATYFEYTTSNVIEPSWDIGSSMFVMEAVQYALSADTGNPRPMTSPVYTPDEIDSSFDYVIYEKGGSILRMAENFLTTPNWKAGLKDYLTNNSYKTGTPEQLFAALEGASELRNVNETLQGWTTQPGYPLITVTSLAVNTPNTTVYNITQAPYNLIANYSGLTWNVPLTYTTQSEAQFDASKVKKYWLLPSAPNTSLLSINESGWIIFNINQVGFYRVNYDADNWAKLKSQLMSNFSVISSINRAQLIDDAFHLARTGHIEYATAFGIASYLKHETAVEPWDAFFKNINYLDKQFQGTSTATGVKQYAQGLLDAPFTALTSNITQTLLTFKSSLTLQKVSQFSCAIGLSSCERMALDLFKAWRQNTSEVIFPPEVKAAMMCTGLQKDVSVEAFLDVWKYYLSTDNAAEKLTVMNALGCINNERAITIYLDAVTNDTANYVRLQDRWIAFRALMSQQSAVLVVLQYIADNFNIVMNALGSKFVSRVMSTAGNTIIQPDQVNKVKSLALDSNVDVRLKDMLNTIVLPAVAKRQAWVASQQGNSVKAWADSFLKSSAPSAAVNVILMLATALFVVY